MTWIPPFFIYNTCLRYHVYNMEGKAIIRWGKSLSWAGGRKLADHSLGLVHQLGWAIVARLCIITTYWMRREKKKKTREFLYYLFLLFLLRASFNILFLLCLGFIEGGFVGWAYQRGGPDRTKSEGVISTLYIHERHDGNGNGERKLFWDRNTVWLSVYLAIYYCRPTWVRNQYTCYSCISCHCPRCMYVGTYLHVDLYQVTRQHLQSVACSRMT